MGKLKTRFLALALAAATAFTGMSSAAPVFAEDGQTMQSVMQTQTGVAAPRAGTIVTADAGGASGSGTTGSPGLAGSGAEEGTGREDPIKTRGAEQADSGAAENSQEKKTDAATGQKTEKEQETTDSGILQDGKQPGTGSTAENDRTSGFEAGTYARSTDAGTGTDSDSESDADANLVVDAGNVKDFFAASEPCQAISLYYIFRDGTGFVGMFSAELRAVYDDSYIYALFNEDPDHFDLEPYVVLNNAVISGLSDGVESREITDECSYDVQTGILRIPAEYVGEAITIRDNDVSADSDAYAYYTPVAENIHRAGELLNRPVTDADARTPVFGSLATRIAAGKNAGGPIRRAPAYGDLDYPYYDKNYEIRSCNNIKVNADISILKEHLGDNIVFKNGVCYYVYDKYADDYKKAGLQDYYHYMGENVGYAVSFDVADGRFSFLDNVGAKGSGFSSIPNGNKAGDAAYADFGSRRWVYCRCIEPVNNRFYGQPFYKSGYIRPLTYSEKADGTQTATLAIVMACDSSTGQNAQDVGMRIRVTSGKTGQEEEPEEPEKKEVHAGVRVQKLDQDTKKAGAQGDADLSGIVFAVEGNGQKFEITTDQNGVAKTGADALTKGTYTIREISTNESYLLSDAEPVTFSVTEADDGKILELDSFGEKICREDEVVRGGVSFSKYNRTLRSSENQGSAYLANAQITIVNGSRLPVQIDGKDLPNGNDPVENVGTSVDYNCGWIPTAAGDLAGIGGMDAEERYALLAKAARTARVMTITTDREGNCSTGAHDLPYGTYYAFESRPSRGYYLNQEWYARIEIREDGVIRECWSLQESGQAMSGTEKNESSPEENALPETAVRFDFSIQKTGIDGTDGAAKSYVPFIIQNLQTDRYGNVVRDPEGNPKINETHVFLTDADGRYSSVITQEDILRSNLNRLDRYYDAKTGRFTREIDTGSTTADLAKSKVFFGKSASTDRCSEAGELMMLPKTDGTRAYSHRGALYFGKYRIAEIQDDKSARAGENLEWEYFDAEDLNQNSVVFEEKGYERYSEKTYHFLIVDTPVLLSSEASDTESKTRTIRAGKDAKVRDTVTYGNLDAGKIYYLRTDYVLADNPDQVVGTNYHPVQNDPMGGLVKFSPEADRSGNKTSAGKVSAEVTLDTSTLTGRQIVANVYIYEQVDGAFVRIASHTFDNMDEEERLSESVFVPQIRSRANDTRTEDRVGTKKVFDPDARLEGVGIEDYATVTNLAPGERYLLEEYMVDKATGEEIQAELYPGRKNRKDRILWAEADGTGADTWSKNLISFVQGKSFGDGRLVTYGGVVRCPAVYVDSAERFGDGHGSLVVCYRLYRCNANDEPVGEPVAVHADTEDENQTIRYIGVRTIAIDKAVKDHVGCVPETDESGKEKRPATHIRDRVELVNIVHGAVYTVQGHLVFQKDFTDRNGAFHQAGETVPLLNGSGNCVTEEVKAEEKNGGSALVDLDFEIDATACENGSVVAFESVYHHADEDRNSNLENRIATHEDLLDRSQTVHFPKIRTAAADFYTDGTVGSVGTRIRVNGKEKGKTTVVDTALLENLVPGCSYTIAASLRYQKDCTDRYGDAHLAGEEIVVNGAPLWAETGIELSEMEDGKVTVTTTERPAVIQTLAPEEGSREPFRIREMDADHNRVDLDVAVTFPSFDSEALAGVTAVGTEILYHKNIRVHAHTDLTDAAETIHYPDIRTTARDTRTGSHAGSILGRLINRIRRAFGDRDADGNGIDDSTQENITDRVRLSNLVPGETYTLRGALVDVDATIESGGKTVYVRADGTRTDVYENLADTDLSACVIEAGASTLHASGATAAVTAYDADRHSVDGYIDLPFALDSSAVQGHKLIIFEKLLHTHTDEKTGEKIETEIARHEEPGDESQSLYEAGISTKAVDLTTGDHVGAVPNASNGQKTVIRDSVTLDHLIPGGSEAAEGKPMKYRLEAVLVNLDASDFDNGIVRYIGADGKDTGDRERALCAKKEFTADSQTREETLVLPVEGKQVQGKTIAVFEQLYLNDMLISIHPAKRRTKDGRTDWDADAFTSQMIAFPSGATNATAEMTGTHTMRAAEKKQAITDRVYFQNLLLDQAYEVSGHLVYAESFTDPAGVRHRAGEKLSGEGVKASAAFSITRRNGKLMAVDQSGKDITETDGFSTLKIRNRFGTRTVSGYLELKFTADTGKLAGASLVAFEEMRHAGAVVFVHHDLTDLPQTIRVPEIGTKVQEPLVVEDPADGRNREVRITDRVRYTNLWTKAEIDEPAYILKGVLMDKTSGKPLTDDNGRTYTAYRKFMPETSDGSVDMQFVLQTKDFSAEGGTDTALDGKTLVVWETLYQADADPEAFDFTEQMLPDEKEVARHADLNDAGQTLTICIPRIRTSAADSVTGIDEGFADRHASVIDRVFYENLQRGRQYRIRASLHEKESGRLIPGTKVTRTITAGDHLTAARKNGRVDGYADIEIPLDASSLKGKTAVAFEELFVTDEDGKEWKVTGHEDLDDTEQDVKYPSIATTAGIRGGGHAAAAGPDLVILDRVRYENLTPGRKYRVRGILMDQESGKAVSVDGKNVTGEKVFTAQRSEGEVTVTFVLQAGALGGRKLVAFEDLYTWSKEQKEVRTAQHHDLKDREQTVEIRKDRSTGKKESGTPGRGTGGNGTAARSGAPKTGDTSEVWLYVLIALVAAAILAAFAKRWRKRAKEQPSGK